MTTRRREVVAGLATATVSVLLALGLLEGALRVLPRGEAAESGTLASPGRDLLLDCYSSNPRGYFDVDLRDASTRARYPGLPPDAYDDAVRRTPFAVEFRYNRMAFRDVEPPRRRPGVRRVAVLGDSFTEGQGVKADDVWPRQLARVLGEQDPGRWEVLSFARRGADFPQLFQTFEMLLAHDPDVVIYGMVLNDAERSPAFEARQSYVNDWIMDRRQQAPGPGGPLARSALFTFVADRLRSWRISRETTRWYQDMYGAANADGWRRTQGYLADMNRTMRARGGSFVIASWPLMVTSRGLYPFQSVNERITGFCLQSGIGLHDLLPVFSGRPLESLWVHPVDMHPNEIAHRLAGESLAPVVRRAAPGR